MELNHNLPVIFNGVIMSASDIPFNSVKRAFRFGDSWFETMRFENGEIRLWNYHKERLLKAFPACSFKLDQVPLFIENYISQVGGQNYRIRLTVFRIDGDLYMAETNNFGYLIEFSELKTIDYHNSIIDISNRIQVFSKRLFPGKTGNSSVYILAEDERKERGLTQIILMNERDEIVETSNSNIFWRKGNAWYTPSLESGCVEGVMRKKFMEVLNSNGYICNEVLSKQDELENCDEICVSNAIIEVKNIHLFQENSLQLHGEKIYFQTKKQNTEKRL